jgi:dihydrofolate reductase
MRKLILRMNLTLDGVAPGKSGGNDVVDLSDEDSWADLFATLDTVDAMVIGGGSQDEYLGYWKQALTDSKATPSERKYAEIAMRTPHFVLSRTARNVDSPNATILSSGVAGIADLKQQPGRDIILWGGPTVAGAAIEAGLVDEYHFEVHPAIAGRGKKLFENVAAARRLRKLDAQTFPSGIAVAKYANA